MSYEKKLEQFRALFENHHNVRRSRLYSDKPSESVNVEIGYKFDKVFLTHSDGSKSGRYMVEHRTQDIYGIKSWTQVNKRRWFGQLDTVSQYDWSESVARPIPGTIAERQQVEREEGITATHKKRGRKPKAAALASD